MHATGEDHVYLVGHATLADYLGFLSERASPPGADQRSRADEWRAAHDRLKELRAAEAGWADRPPVAPLPPALEPLLADVHADPIFQRAFAVLPAEVRLVELDRLVVCQRLINLTHVARLKERWGGPPSAGQLFRICLPYDQGTPAFRVGRGAKKDEVVFLSDSNDLRVLECTVLRPEEVPGFRPLGPVAGVVGLVVGFGSNYLNVIAGEGRLVLNNGYHRAYALRELGVTHVPCVLQRLSRREELGAVGGGTLRRKPDDYLVAPRPPVLKDFFDPRLCRPVRLAPRGQQVRVSFTVEELPVPRA